MSWTAGRLQATVHAMSLVFQDPTTEAVLSVDVMTI